MPMESQLRFRVKKRAYRDYKVNRRAEEQALLYKQIFEDSPVSVFIIDPNTLRIIEVNRTACDYYGYTHEQFTSLRVTDLNPMSEADIRQLGQIIVEKKRFTFQTRHRLASGAVRDVEVLAGLIDVGSSRFVYSMVQDITDRLQREQAQAENQRLYRHFVQNIPHSGVMMFDMNLRYTVADGPFLLRHGTPPQSMIGKTPCEVLQDGTADFMTNVFKRALSGESFDYIREGQDHAYKAYVTPVKDESGTIIGGMILTHDISEIRRSAAALLDVEKRFYSVVNTMAEGVVVHNQDGSIQSSNPAAERILGLTADQLMGRSSIDPRWNTIHEDGTPFPGETHPAMITLKTGHPQSNIIMGVHKPDGSVSWISINSRPIIQHGHGHPTAVVVTIIDITERKRAEDALRASENRFHSLVDLAPVGIIQTDSHGKRVFCNSRWCEMTGITLEQALGDTQYETIYPPDLPYASGVWASMMDTNLPFENAVFRYQKPDKSVVWVSGSGRALFGSDGQVGGYIGAVTDISERKSLEDALIISEARYRTLFDFAPVGIVEMDIEGHTIYANDYWSTLSGIPVDSNLVANALTTIHPDDLDFINGVNRSMMDTEGEVNAIEYRFRHPDGKLVWVQDSSRPIHDLEGKLVGYILALSDVSRRKELEEALRTSEERLRAVTDSVPDLITQADQENIITYASPSSRALLGLEPHRMIGRNAAEYIHPDDNSRFHAARMAALKDGSNHYVVEARMRHADGHYIWVETNNLVHFDTDGEYAGWVKVSRDITIRRELEYALRTSEERRRMITDNIQDVVVLTNAMTEVIFVSPSITAILGYQPAEMLGAHPREFVKIDERAWALGQYESALQKGHAHTLIETQVTHAEGHFVNVEVSIKLMRDEQSKFTGAVFVIRDITERKRMEALLVEQEKLQTALDKELELNRLKNRMMDRISHEFRTPLAIVQSSMETLTFYYERLTAAQRTEKEVKVRDQIHRITEMLDEISQVIKGSFTPEHIHRFDTDMSALCRDITRQLEKTLNHPGRYELDVPESAIISVDANVVKKAVQHIMHNAALYSAPNSVVVVRLIKSDTQVTLSITDSGIGIPPAEIVHIFDPFFRGSNIGETGGLGIRMTLARAAIEAHGGEIEVESKLGLGTTFTITLPVRTNPKILNE